MKKVPISGVPDNGGAGAVCEKGRWRGVVLLRPWQGPDGKVHREPLHVRLPPVATSSAAMKASARAYARATCRMDVELLPKRPNRLTSAVLVGRIARAEPDAKLAHANAAVSQVVTVRDPRLGRLVRAAKDTCFTGRMRLGGRVVRLTVWQAAKNSPEDTVARASQLVTQLAAKLATVPAQVAKKMLALAIRWQEDGQPAITLAGLQRKLRLQAISVPETGTRLELDFDSGQVFTDHGVTATVAATGRVVAASIC
jgi:hypothetical protein